MVKKQGRARELADLVERPVKDYDPEIDAVPDESDRSDDGSSDDERLGTEHYVAVGKSKLRRYEPLSLGPQYRGTKVSREALDADEEEEEDEEEPEEEEEEASADQDEMNDHRGLSRNNSKPTTQKNRHAKRATAADFMESGEDEESEDEMGGSDSEMEEEEDEESDESGIGGLIDDEAEESDEEETAFTDEETGLSDDSDGENQYDDDDNEEEEEEDGGEKTAERHNSREKSKSWTETGITASVKEMMGEQSVVKSLLKTVDADVQKGRAVQRQRKGFDALLNVRIRLQKSIIAANSYKYAEQSEGQMTEPYEAAERSALQLWSALDDFRTSMCKGKKRKHAETDNVSTSALWDRMELHEKNQAARRKQVLEKWSRDAKKTSITSSSANKFTSNAEKPITAMLSAEMDAPERLIKRTRTPRSCAPYHVAQKVNEDASIYDDADFYQLLLKELVDQRSGDGPGSGLQAATIHYAAVKEAKAKRHVDTRASKGRKMRFTPMPKLQNFMAPEDRRSWEQGAIDRFFGTLFGQKMVLDEESSDEEMDNVAVEDAGLRLF